MALTVLWSLLVVFPGLSLAVVNEDLSSSCLSNLHVEWSSSSELALAWEYTCSRSPSLLFKVYYEHLEWKACPTGQQDERRGGPGRNNLETREVTAQLSNLHAFSVYRVTVKALHGQRRPEERIRVAETKEGLPLVSPRPLDVIEDQRELAFGWREPSVTDCSDFNAMLNGAVYTLSGVDPWNLQLERSGTTSEGRVVLADLLPYSRYLLHVHSRTSEEGLYNPSVFLEMSGRTKASTPTSPRSLRRLHGDGESATLQWLLPYPPTGEAERFVLRWKHANHTRWSNKEDVGKRDNLCPPSRNASQQFKRFCYTLNGLTPGGNYTFQVSAYNAGVSVRSPWSSSFTFVSSVSETTGTTSSSSLLSILVLLVVFSVLLVAALILLLLVRRRRETKKKEGGNNKKYDTLPVYEAGGSSVGGSTMTRSTVVSRIADSQEERPGPSSGPASSAGLAMSVLRGGRSGLVSEEETRSRKSIQDVPLPDLPENHVYEELPPHPPSQNDRSFSAMPTTESPVYLPPLNRSDVSQGSNNTLDVDEYLKPTFNHFEHIDTSDLTPPLQSPPPIPIVSYKQ